MIRGAIVGESLRTGVVIDSIPLTVRRLERLDAGIGEQPPCWTIIWFEAADADADGLADQLSAGLEQRGGWYAHFSSDSDMTVVFAQHIFRYRRGDIGERAKVAAYARSVGVPEEQLDWDM